MKALKLQSGDAGKPSKAISSNRAARPLPIRLINRASYKKAPRLLRGTACASAPVRRIAAPRCVFRQADLSVPKPQNNAPACGAAGRGPPHLMAAMGMLALLIASAAAQPGAPAAITDGIVADYAFHGYLFLPGGIPATGDTVWVVNAAESDSLACVTDGDGRYENNPLTNVPDAYRQEVSLRAFPNPDPRTLVLETPHSSKSGGEVDVKLYDVRGREVTDDQRIPAGAYIARATTPSGENATVKVVFSQSAEPDKLSLEQRISDTTVQKYNPPLAELLATVKVNKQEYEPVNEPVTLQPQGTIIDDITLQTNGVEYRVFGEAWNQRARDKVTGTLTLRTHSDDALHQAIIDTNATNHFDITLTGYEPTEQISIWIDNPHYTNNSTSVFPKGIVASTNNITRKLHEAPTTTLEELTNPQQGIYVYALADNVYENPSFRQGLQGQNVSVIKDYPHQEITHIVYTTNVTTGEPISELEEEQALYVAQQLHNYNTPRNGHTMLNSNIVTMSTPPADVNRTIILYRGEWIGQGNTQLPANQPFFNRATAFVNSWDGVGYLFAEAIEAMRVGDDASGHNWWAVGGDFNSPTLTDIGHDMYISGFLFPGENPNPQQ